jgi:WD40 repeat protein
MTAHLTGRPGSQRRRSVFLAILPALFGALCFSEAACAQETLVPEDTCIVELQLPAGATVEVDGQDYGHPPLLTFDHLDPRQIRQAALVIHYPSGETSQHALLLEGGRRLRLARLDPGNVKLELVEMAGLPPIMNYVTTPEMKYLAAGHQNGTVSIWDMQRQRLLRYFAGKLAWRGVSVTRVAMSLSLRKEWLLAEAHYSKEGKDGLSIQSTVSILYDIRTGKKLRTFDGTPCAFGPNDQWLVTTVDGAWNNETRRRDPGSVVLWDAESGQKLRTFDLDSGNSSLVALSPDGRFLLGAIAGDLNKETDRADPWSAIVWDVESGQKLRTFAIGSGRYVAAAFSPDGRSLLIAAEGEWSKETNRSGPGSIVLWDVESGQKLRTYDVGSGGRTAAAFSPDGRRILTAAGSGKRGSLILWDVESGQKLRTIEVGSDLEWQFTVSIAFGRDGRRVMVGLANLGSAIWDIATGAKTWAFADPANPFANCTAGAHFSAKGTRLVTVHGMHRNATHGVVLWDAQTGQKLRSFHLGNRGLHSTDFSPDGRKMAAVLDRWNANTKCSEYSVASWDVESGQQLQTFDMGSGYLASVDFSLDHRLLLTRIRRSNEKNEPAYAIVWSVETGQKLRTFEIDTWPLSSACFSPDGQNVLIRDGEFVSLWRVPNGKKLRTYGLGSQDERASAAFSPDGQKLLIPGKESLSLCDVGSGQKLRTLDLGSERLDSGEFSPDGRRILTRTYKPSDGRSFLQNQLLTLWDVESGEKLRTIDTGCWNLRSINFSSDWRELLALDYHGKASLWDLENGTRLRTIDLGQQDAISSVSFDPSGRYIRAIGAWRLLYVIDRATGDCVLHGDAAGDDILYTTPDGYFDGPAEARQRVCYRIGTGLNVVPVDRFFQDFYRPGLLAEIHQGQRPMPDVQLGHSLPPIVQILSPKPGEVETAEVTLEVQVTDQGGGVSNWALFQNGARVLAPGQTRQEGKSLYRSFRVGLIEGENRLSVKAASGDGSWESEPAEVTLRYERPLAKSRMYVLAVGINKYADASLNLNFAATDAQAMAELFRRRGQKLYEQVSATTLTDQQATKNGIKESLRQLAAQTRPQDTLLLFLAGHGMTIGQRYYFVPHEVRKEAERIEDDIRKQGLPDDELSDYLGTAKALKRILILDTCASGGALRSVLKQRSGFALRGAIERLSHAQGLLVIAAASSTEQAQESKELGHGVLSYSLLAGLKAVDSGPLAGKHVQPNSPDRVVDVLEGVMFADGQGRRLTGSLHGAAQDVQLSKQGSSFPLLPVDE